MYQALYRKWRPRTFSDVAGQEHITVTLRRQVSSGRLSHAYLFVGTRGTGKTSCAKILSRAVNCTNPNDGDPCNTCEACVGIESGGILDVLELDAASNNGVDNVRALRDEAVYSPASVHKRIYIIDEVHMLSISAFNALLKLLEEPPEHLIFILATTELHKVPATILSRCQRFSFKRLKPSEITARLNTVAENESLTLTDDAAEKLAALSDGSMRDALSLLDQCSTESVVDLARVLDTIGLAGQTELFELACAVANRDSISALGILDRLYGGGRDLTSLLSEFATLLRDVLIYKLSSDSPLLSSGFGDTQLEALSSLLSSERVFYYLETIRDTSQSFTRGGGVKISAEMCIIRMCDESLSGDISTLIARIERLESQGQSTAPSVPVAATTTRAVPSDAAVEKPKPIVAEPLPTPGDIPPPAQDVTSPEPVAEPVLTETAPAESVPTDTASTDAAPTKQSADSADFWQDVLDLLKSDVPVYSLLRDKSNVSATLQGGTIVVTAGSPFTVNMIESKTFVDAIKNAARTVLGHDVALRVEAGGASEEDKRGKLDSLSAFDIVKFE